MKKYYFLYIILHAALSLLSQAKPLDTSYHSNGSIKSILFGQDFDITGHQVHVFYDRSNDIKKTGRRTNDTVYEHQPKWPIIKEIALLDSRLIRISRFYYPGGSYTEKNIFLTGAVLRTFSFSSISTFFKLEGVSVTYHFKNEKPIALYISIWDFSKNKQSNNLVNIISQKTLENKFQTFQISSNRKIRIENSDLTSFPVRILFLNDKEFWEGTFIEYYQSGSPKEFGHYKNKNKIGQWYEFYDQSIIKSYGKYDGISLTAIGDPLFLKNGIWYCFDEKGNPIKNEVWQKGKLIR